MSFIVEKLHWKNQSPPELILIEITGKLKLVSNIL